MKKIFGLVAVVFLGVASQAHASIYLEPYVGDGRTGAQVAGKGAGARNLGAGGLLYGGQCVGAGHGRLVV